MLETLLGGLFGGVFRLVPEVMKFFDRKNERAHEVTMRDLDMQAVKVQADANLKLAEQQRATALDTKGLDALMTAVKTQGERVGNWFFDGLNVAVRPTITFAYFGLYAACRIATFIVATQGGIPALDVLRSTWTPDDQAILAGIINFWFLGRVFDKVGR